MLLCAKPCAFNKIHDGDWRVFKTCTGPFCRLDIPSPEMWMFFNKVFGVSLHIWIVECIPDQIEYGDPDQLLFEEKSEIGYAVVQYRL